MKRKAKALNEKTLLAKNPKAAKVFAENRSKLAGRRREQKPYALGLPYGKSALASAVGEDANAPRPGDLFVHAKP